MRAPTLETERLILRAYELDDFPLCAAMWADPEVVRFIGGVASTREQSWARFVRYAGHWALLGYGFWAVFEREGGAYAGELGLADFRRDVEPPLGHLETGWVLARAAQGRGYATEAMRTVLRWADERFPGEPTSCVIDAVNAASMRVAAKCGYTPVGTRSYHGEQIIVLERPHGAALAAQ